MLVYLLVVAVLLVTALLAFGGVALLHLQGGAAIAFVVLILLIGVAAAGVVLFLHFKAKKEGGSDGDAIGGGDTNEVDLLLNDANRKLRSSTLEGAKALSELPLIYLLGDMGAAKTSLVVRSGMEPELLAGTAPRAGEADVASTPLLNLWFTRQAAILEAGQGIRQSTALLTRLVQRTRPKAYRAAFGPGAPPRAAVVCVAANLFTGTDAAASIASARATGAQLREISRLLGAALPVYVIVTKLDDAPNFAEYVRNLSNEEAQSVLGVTLKRSDASLGVYADQASRTLASELEALCYKLGEFRVEMLNRETDPANAPSVYQFPYEFGKLFRRNGLTEYLVELCKPSQLSANPYLRGFYFTGVRAQTVERETSVPARVAPIKPADPGATQIFNPEHLRQLQNPATPPPVRSSVRVPQWTFLARLFPQIILGDKTALSATQQTAPARVFRRALFATLAGVFALYSLLLLISYLNNAALERRITNAAKALPVAGISSSTLATPTDLQTLDQLRQVIVDLDRFNHDGAPWTYRLGLYQGERLSLRARQAYFDRFRPLLLTPAQAHVLAYLQALLAKPAENTDYSAYSAAYDPLKAYLITAGNHEHSDGQFLTPVMMRYWPALTPIEEPQRRLANAQFDFYAEELLRRDPYKILPESSVVTHAQVYLSNFGDELRIYQAMQNEAEKKSPGIDFNKQYPGSDAYVLEGHHVKGAFTRTGFDFMQDAFRNPKRYFQGEGWVLGDDHSTLVDSAALIKRLTDKYSADYIAEWRLFLSGAKVKSCGDLHDAAPRFAVLAGSGSPLLELLFLVSHNTSVSDPQIKEDFAASQKLVDANATSQLLGPTNQAYTDALLNISQALSVVAQNPAAVTDPGAGLPVITNTAAAETAVQKTAAAFPNDPLSQTDKKDVLRLLREPIICAAGLVKGIGTGGAKAAGAALCDAMNKVMRNQPFSPNASAQASIADIDNIFAPGTGALWTTLNNPALKPLVMQVGNRYVPASTGQGSVSQSFTEFVTRAARISSALYPAGAKGPSFTFNLRFLPGTSKGVQNATLVVDGQRLPTTQQFTWNGMTAHQASLVYDSYEIPPLQGTWALFQLVSQGHATRSQAGVQVDFPITTGIAGHNTDTGRTASFDLSGPGSDLFGSTGVSGLHCVQPVVK